ncbi:MAG: type II secretion system protein GspN [bacterium]|nr:type II secretion system protein GspN [bacterium]
MILQISGYALYGLVICLVVVYLTFPYDLLKQRLAERFSHPGMHLTVDHIGPAFPPGLALDGIRLTTDHPTFDGPVMQAETLDVRPVWRSLWSGAIQAKLEADLYRGRFQGRVLSAGAAEDAGWQIRGDFADIQLAHHPIVQKEKGAFLRGQLDGEVDLTLGTDGKLSQGVLNLRLQSVILVAGQHPGLPLQRDISCNTLQSQIKLTATQMQIVSFTCKGDDLTIQARGTVNLRQPWQNSSLNVHLQIQSESAYKQELGLIATLVRRRLDRRGMLSFRIRGTMQQPRFGT